MTGQELDGIIALIAAVAGLLTALGTFLGVLPKLGLHNAKIDAVTAKVDDLAATTQKVAVEAKAAEPVVANIIAAPAPAPEPPAPPAA